jgi:hypothetical protein
VLFLPIGLPTHGGRSPNRTAARRRPASNGLRLHAASSSMAEGGELESQRRSAHRCSKPRRPLTGSPSVAERARVDRERVAAPARFQNGACRRAGSRSKIRGGRTTRKPAIARRTGFHSGSRPARFTLLGVPFARDRGHIASPTRSARNPSNTEAIAPARGKGRGETAAPLAATSVRMAGSACASPPARACGYLCANCTFCRR